MNDQWKTFLESQSARIDADGTVRFPDASLDVDCALMDLSELGLIAVRGPEAEIFLQGQLTNDVVGLAAGHSRLGSHCSPKGRVLASFRVFKLSDGVYLQTPRTMVEAAIRRLRMYLLRSKATVEEASDRLVAIAVAGECAPSLLASQADRVPAQDNDLTAQPATDGDLVLIRIPGSVPRFQVLGPPPILKVIWENLSATATTTNSDYWSLLDIRAGIPLVYPQTSDAFLPQMLNLQLLEGVSFKKGCYTGQEVVARMRYLGKLKKRMYFAKAAVATCPMPGDGLYSDSSSSSQTTGRVVDARMNGNGACEMLVVAEIGAAEKSDVRLGGPDGSLLALSEPPYGFAADQE